VVDGLLLCAVSFFHKCILAACSIMEHEKHLSILYQKQVQATQFSSKAARDKWLQYEIDFGMVDGLLLCAISFFNKKFLATCSKMEHEKHLSILYQKQVRTLSVGISIGRYVKYIKK